jgi:catalase
MTDKGLRFTTAAGAPVADNTSILTAGQRGPALLQDVWLIEKLAHFDRVNSHQIPVNAPRCPHMSYHRDGAMITDGNLGPTVPYHPNAEGVWANQPDFSEPPLQIDGRAEYWDHRVDDDHWEQPGNLFRMMTSVQKETLFGNTARAMGDAPLETKLRHIANCSRADPAYGAGVAAALGINTAVATLLEIDPAE